MIKRLKYWREKRQFKVIWDCDCGGTWMERSTRIGTTLHCPFCGGTGLIKDGKP